MRFDFAISFSGAERDLARRLAEALIAKGCRVFFDEHFEHEMLGQDGADYLNNVFFRESRFCVALVSHAYQERAWAQLERRAAQARELGAGPGFLLPVLVDGTHPDWLLPTRIYFDLSQRDILSLVDVLQRKAMLVGVGPYALRGEFRAGGTGHKVAAVRDSDDCMIWGGGGGRIKRLARDPASGTWHLDELPVSVTARHILACQTQLVAVPDLLRDGPVLMYDLVAGTSRRHDLAQIGMNAMVTHCDWRDDALVLTDRNRGVVHLDLHSGQVRTLVASTNDDENYCACFLSSRNEVAIARERELTICSPSAGRIHSTYELPEPPVDMVFLPSSSVIALALWGRVCLLDIHSGVIRHEYETAQNAISALASAQGSDVIACVSGFVISQNSLELTNSCGTALGRMESGRDEPWQDIALSVNGRSLAATRGFGSGAAYVQLFERISTG